MKRSKAYQNADQKIDHDALYSPGEAIELAKSTKVTKFDPTVEVNLRLGVDKGSSEPHTTKVGTLTSAQLRQIAETKMPDLNATTIEAAEKIIAGTARSMGIKVEG